MAEKFNPGGKHGTVNAEAKGMKPVGEGQPENSKPAGLKGKATPVPKGLAGGDMSAPPKEWLTERSRKGGGGGHIGS